MASKYVDISSVMQVIGCVFNDPSLLDNGDKYVITEQDFNNEFHRVAFGAIYKIYELGAKKITLENISDFLSSRPKQEAIFNQEKGNEWLMKCAAAAIPSAFDYYYGRLKKFSLLRAMDSYGVDPSNLYDPDILLDTKKHQAQEEWLDNTPITDIANKFVERVDKIVSSYVYNTFGEVQRPDEGAAALKERLKQRPDVGVPLYGPLINTVTRGARLRKLFLRSAPSGYGKAIPNDTVIPTPNGYKTVGEIKTGDYLFGQDGKPTKVLQIHPQPTKKTVYEITFSDGRKAKCCEDHLWEYRYKSHHGFVYRVESVRQILDRASKLTNGLKNSDSGYRFSVKLNEAVKYQEKEYFLPPYVMGAFLGDGSFRYNSSQRSLQFSSKSNEIPEKIISYLKNTTYKKSSENNFSYTFKPTNNLTHNIWVEEFLKDYPELWNCKSEDKFIPQEYLLGSINQRYELLKGLMDTDGTIDLEGRTSFTTVSKKLKDNVIELCHSLGMIANCSVDSREGKYTTGECYHISIQTKKNNKPNLFSLKSKLDRAIAYSQSTKREEHKDHLSIVSINKTDEFADMTCFTVDNEDHLFLMNDFIVTHNTRTMIADVCYIGCNMIYDDNFGWIKNGTAEPVLYITTEQELEEIQTMMWAFISGVDEEHILNNTYVGDEEERVDKAIEILANSKIYIVELPDFSLQDVENVIKANIRENDVKYVFHDYIMTSLKILEEISGRTGGVKLREDNILFMLSRRLKDIANEHGVFILSGTQLNGDWKESESPDQNLLRGAKSIADSIDFGMHVLPATQSDHEKLGSLIKSNTFDTPNVKMSIYKNRRGRYKGVYLWVKADYGTCRFRPMFATTWDYELIQMQDLKILTDEEGAF